MIKVTTSIMWLPDQWPSHLASGCLVWFPRYNSSLLTMTMRLTLFLDKLFTTHGYLKLCWSQQR